MISIDTHAYYMRITVRKKKVNGFLHGKSIMKQLFNDFPNNAFMADFVIGFNLLCCFFYNSSVFVVIRCCF